MEHPILDLAVAPVSRYKPPMGKKFLIGCLVVIGIAVVGGGLAGYFFLYKPIAGYYAQLTSQAKEVVELNARVADRSSYTPPSDGVLTPGQVESFVRVQRFIVEQMGPYQEELKRKYQDLGEGYEGGARTFGITDLVSVWTDLKEAFIKLKEVQVAALNRENLSLEEYRWIRARFWEARGVGFVAVNLERIAEAVEERNPELLKDAPSESLAPERNRELVSPYEDESVQWLSYAWLGL
jgi:hypothetical protein